MIPLLAAQLFIPTRRSRDSVVERSRLTDRLAPTNGQRLTLISAPAGFGKSRLVSEWSQQSEYCVPWLSLDASDNDPARFSTYFIAVLQMLQPDLGASALALLASAKPQTPPIETILTLHRIGKEHHENSTGQRFGRDQRPGHAGLQHSGRLS